LEVEAQVEDRVLGPPLWSVAIAHRQEVLFVDGSKQFGTGHLYQFVFQCGYSQRSFLAVVLGDVHAPHPLRAVAFRFQSSDQVLDVFHELLPIVSRRYFIYAAGRVFVDLFPALQQQAGIQHPVQILKAVVFAGFRPRSYSAQ
jgi:hypothetical protein